MAAAPPEMPKPTTTTSTSSDQPVTSATSTVSGMRVLTAAPASHSRRTPRSPARCAAVSYAENRPYVGRAVRDLYIGPACRFGADVRELHSAGHGPTLHHLCGSDCGVDVV